MPAIRFCFSDSYVQIFSNIIIWLISIPHLLDELRLKIKRFSTLISRSSAFLFNHATYGGSSIFDHTQCEEHTHKYLNKIVFVILQKTMRVQEISVVSQTWTPPSDTMQKLPEASCEPRTCAAPIVATLRLHVSALAREGCWRWLVTSRRRPSWTCGVATETGDRELDTELCSLPPGSWDPDQGVA
jgi:hypothetical protein